MGEINEIVQVLRAAHDEHGFLIVDMGENRFEEDMVSRILNNPGGNNYKKLHGIPQWRERTRYRIHGMNKGFSAISHRRKYCLKSMEKYCIKQCEMVGAVHESNY